MLVVVLSVRAQRPMAVTLVDEELNPIDVNLPVCSLRQPEPILSDRKSLTKALRVDSNCVVHPVSRHLRHPEPERPQRTYAPGRPRRP